ncbi:hypothetical protein EDB19DRAFT_311334 [Suillus lakei]|nr:hypothetical protein EDB19DRAFT_311334 [Suillus lakei]
MRMSVYHIMICCLSCRGFAIPAPEGELMEIQVRISSAPMMVPSNVGVVFEESLPPVSCSPYNGWISDHRCRTTDNVRFNHF